MRNTLRDEKVCCFLAHAPTFTLETATSCDWDIEALPCKLHPLVDRLHYLIYWWIKQCSVWCTTCC